MRRHQRSQKFRWFFSELEEESSEDDDFIVELKPKKQAEKPKEEPKTAPKSSKTPEKKVNIFLSFCTKSIFSRMCWIFVIDASQKIDQDRVWWRRWIRSTKRRQKRRKITENTREKRREKAGKEGGEKAREKRREKSREKDTTEKQQESQRGRIFVWYRGYGRCRRQGELFHRNFNSFAAKIFSQT